MNKRNACFAGLAAAVTLFAGCAAQYRNTSTCEEEMRKRLADTTFGALKVTHSATTYRGARVVVEGQLEHGAAPATAASAGQAASEAASATAANARQAPTVTAPMAQAAALPGTISVPTTPAATPEAGPEGKPTTPVAALAEKLGIKKAPTTPTAAECTFNESGLATFRWLAPAPLAKTTPDPNAGSD